MNVLLEIAYVGWFWLIALWLLPKFDIVKQLELKKIEVRLLFSLKVLVGIGFLLFYELYYGSRSSTDAFRFFDDAALLYEVWKSDPGVFFKIILGVSADDPKVVAAIDQLNNWYKEHKHGVFNDNMTIIRFNSLVHLVSFGVYHVHTVMLNFLSFLGLAALVHVFKRFKADARLTFYLLVLFPGALFWTSGVLKENLLVFVMGYFMFFAFKVIHQEGGGRSWLGLLFFTFLFLQIKNYVLIGCVTGILFYAIWNYWKPKNWMIFFGAFIGLGVMLVFVLNHLFGLGIPENIYQKQHDFLNEIAISKPGSAFEIFVLEPNWKSLVLHAPNAFFNTAFRPFIWETHSIVSLMASIENLFLLVLLIYVLFNRDRLEDRRIVFVWSGLMIMTFVFLISGWVTPVFGALVRYKIPGILFLIGVLMIASDDQKVLSLLDQLKAKYGKDK